jgi:MYXO-CTERM domain-containing protein
VHQQKTIEDPKLGEQCSFGGGCGLDYSSAGNRGLPPDYQPPAPGNQDAGLPPDLTTLGAYELAVLGGADLNAVENWLTAHNYFFDANDVAALAPYLASGWTVTAVRVRSTPISKTPLTPIAFTFESDVLRLPVAVARDPSGGQMPLTAYVAAEGRYDFSGASVPYAEYSSAVSSTEFLTRNDLRIDLSAPIDLDPIAYRDYQNNEHQDTVTVVDEVHVPVTRCDWGCRGCACSVSGERVVPFPALALLALLGFRVLRRRRR